MAVVTFTSSMRSGLRLQDFFTVALGDVDYQTDGDRETATFNVKIDGEVREIFYERLGVTAMGGDVSYIRFGPAGSFWLTYGELAGPALFSYSGDLAVFHEDGAVAVARIMAGNDRLVGSSHGDYMEGYDGHDTLNGGGGADTLDGGAGNDTYFVDNMDDRVFEAPGGGYDVVWTGASFAMAAGSEIEELRAAADAGALSLTGNEFNNFIAGASGDDTLDGAGGIDTLTGGIGNDLYIVDSPFDMVWEEAGQGDDTVIANTSFVLSANIEVLKAAGISAINLTGNALANDIFGNLGANEISGLDGNDRLYGDGGDDRIFGASGNDLLYGGIGNDFLDGGSDNDELYGDVGNDTMGGGAGHDLLYGGTGNNRLMGQGGNDTLYGGAHADNLQGGDDHDVLYGDVGNDHLDGGAGKDTLYGGWGKDSFVFKNALNARTNVDTIKDFNVKDDTIRLENSIFKKLGKAGKLKSDFFTVGSKAQDGNDYLIYNKKNGYLSYDADGSGSKHKAVLFFRLKSGLALSDKDFYVI